jgi:hypothetical protein
MAIDITTGEHCYTETRRSFLVTCGDSEEAQPGDGGLRGQLEMQSRQAATATNIAVRSKMHAQRLVGGGQ